MGRKKADDDELRRKALELRRKGLSLREIGKELGRSSYKAWELVSPYESHQPKITQVAELSKKIDELNSKIEGLIRDTYAISAEARRFKKLKELNERVSQISEELDSVKEAHKGTSWSLLPWAVDYVGVINDIASEKFSDTEWSCKNMDKDGFCTYLGWRHKKSALNMRQALVDGEVRYRLNVKQYPVCCVPCIHYERSG